MNFNVGAAIGAFIGFIFLINFFNGPASDVVKFAAVLAIVAGFALAKKAGVAGDSHGGHH